MAEVATLAAVRTALAAAWLVARLAASTATDGGCGATAASAAVGTEAAGRRFWRWFERPFGRWRLRRWVVDGEAK